jgi:hypothetical protein
MGIGTSAFPDEVLVPTHGKSRTRSSFGRRMFSPGPFGEPRAWQDKKDYPRGVVEPTMGKAQGDIYVYAVPPGSFDPRTAISFLAIDRVVSGYYDEAALEWIRSRREIFAPLFPEGFEIAPPYIDPG